MAKKKAKAKTKKRKSRKKALPAFAWISEELRGLAVPVDDLVEDPANARLHPERNLEAVLSSLRAFGQLKPIVVRKENMVVAAGNGTLVCARALGWTHLAANVVAMDQATATAFAIADNRSAELADWDEEVLGQLLASVQDEFPLEDLGFTDEEFAELLAGDGPGAPGVDPGPDPLPEGEPDSKPGQVYQLGRHLVYCGDSREVAIAKVFGERAIDCVWTDPPYGVNYKEKQAHLAITLNSPGSTHCTGPVPGDDLTPNQVEALVRVALRLAWARTKPGGPIYCCGPSGDLQIAMLRAYLEAGWLMKRQLVWLKNHMVAGRADYHSLYEPVLYGWKPGAAHCWYGERDKRDVLPFDRPRGSKLHPTMKPIELIEACVTNSTKRGDVVYDPFGGSGSTLIACERTGRVAWLVELDERYVDVIRRRFTKFAIAEKLEVGTGALLE